MKTALAILSAALLLATTSIASAGTPKKRPRVQKRLTRVAAPTTNAVLDKWVRIAGKKVKGGNGRWTFTYNGVAMMIITDQRADRMRIITPISAIKKLTRAALLTLMRANFDRALDAKYAIWNKQVWSTFVHPLSPLRRREFFSAAKQVAALVKTYGTTFSSIGVVFSGGKRSTP